MKRRTSPPRSLPERVDRAEIPGRRRYRYVAAGDRVSISAETGEFRVKWFSADGSAVTVFGPLSHSEKARVGHMRTFRIDRVSRLHRSVEA